MGFGAGEVGRALGMTHQSLGHLSRELMPDKPPNRHYRYSAVETLWLACYRHARAAGLEAWPAKVFVGSPTMLLMLQTLFDRAAPDPREAVKRLRNISVLFGARYRFTESGHETEMHGEPLLFEVQRLPQKLMEPRPTAGVAEMTVFLAPLAQPLNVLARLIEENRNAT